MSKERKKYTDTFKLFIIVTSMQCFLNQKQNITLYTSMLKLTEFTPIFENSLNKESYRPISLISHIRRKYLKELILINVYMDPKFSNTQYSLLKIMEKWN